MVTGHSNSFSSEIWAALSKLRSPSTYGAGKLLFQYGQPTRGVYMVEKGHVDLLLSTDNGAKQLFERVGPGSLLALSEAVSGGPHKLTAVVANEAEISFVGRQELLQFMRQNPACCMHLVRLLSENLHSLYHRFQSDPRWGQQPPRVASSKQRPYTRADRPN